MHRKDECDLPVICSFNVHLYLALRGFVLLGFANSQGYTKNKNKSLEPFNG